MKRQIIVVQGAREVDAIPHLGPIATDHEIRFANSEAELMETLRGANILLGWDFKADELIGAWPCADSLEWVHWSGAGVDAVLFDEFVQSQVVLTNAKGIFDRAMAEYVLALVLALAKRLPETVTLQNQRQWRHRLTGRIDGASALVVGAGSIGRAIGQMLRAVGMRVRGVARTARGPAGDFENIVALEDLSQVLPESDYVISVLPGTQDTRDIFDAKAFAAMRTGARFINVGRGQSVDEDALMAALSSNHLAGAALDVFATEPLPEASGLWELPNVIVSPHMSGDFEQYAEDLGWLFADNFRRFQLGQTLMNKVDKARGY